MYLILLTVFALFQTNTVLTPTVVAIVTALFTVAVGGVGVAVLRDRINGNSRIKGLLASLATGYGIVAPFISSFPRWAGVAVSIIGLLVVLTSGRLQGADDRKTD